MKKKKTNPMEEDINQIKSPKLQIAVRRLLSHYLDHQGVVHDVEVVKAALSSMSPCLDEVRAKAKHLLSLEQFKALERREQILMSALDNYEKALGAPSK